LRTLSLSLKLPQRGDARKNRLRQYSRNPMN
jgi:hypothetical protein